MQRGLGAAMEKSPREESAPRKASGCKMFTLGVYFEALRRNHPGGSAFFASLAPSTEARI